MMMCIMEESDSLPCVHLKFFYALYSLCAHYYSLLFSFLFFTKVHLAVSMKEYVQNAVSKMDIGFPFVLPAECAVTRAASHL